MKRRYLGRLIFIGIVLTGQLFQYAVAEEEPAIAWIEGRVFEIIGTDNRSVSFTNVLGDHVADTCNRYLEAGSHDFSRRILVILWPKEQVEFKGSYRIKISPRGQVELDFCWSESLSFEASCHALVEAYLLQYARFNYGAGAEKRVRFWAVSALVLRNYLSLRPAQLANYIDKARQSEMPEIETLLSLRLQEVAQEKRNLYQGYWLFQILRESGLSHTQVNTLLDQAISGEMVEAQMAMMLFSGKDEQLDINLEAWWQNELRNYLAQGREFCESLIISRSWIEEMANFEALSDSSRKLPNLMKLWDYRHDETVRSTLGARCEIIRLRMEQVNPAYFNAALSLGALYETILEAEHKHEFISAVTTYLNEWEDTKRLHARSDEFMSTCD